MTEQHIEETRVDEPQSYLRRDAAAALLHCYGQEEMLSRGVVRIVLK